MEQARVKIENHSVIIDIPYDTTASTSAGSSSSSSESYDSASSTSAGSSSSSESSHDSAYDLTQHGNAAVHNNQPSSDLPVHSFCQIIFNATLLFSFQFVLGYEKPQSLLFAWIVGYTAACLVSIGRTCSVSSLSCFLEIFCAVWFVLGNYCIFGKQPDAPIMLYSYGVALLVFDYIKYIAVIIIWACGYSSGLLQEEGPAPTESFNALQTYKCILRGGGGDGGGGAGAENERSLPHEDALCCICLEDYCDNDVLKELPCTHLFHASCVDTWLKIKAFCPLCICRVRGDSSC